MTQPILQTDIPIPADRRRTRSRLRLMAESLSPGQCLTCPAADQDAQREMAKRLNAMRTSLKREFAERDFTVRQMYGEVDGEVTPVVRMWRTQ